MPKILIITGEYPPNGGGVADYSFQLVKGLRSLGCSVDVLVFDDAKRQVRDLGVTFIGPASNVVSLWRATRAIRSTESDVTLFLQYTPQMFGLKSMNLGFAYWVRRIEHRRLWVMFHEVYVNAALEAPWKHRILERVTRSMARVVAGRAERCFASSPAWSDRVIGLTHRTDTVSYLPIPSNLQTKTDDCAVEAIRAKLRQGPQQLLVGHFGTYGGPLRSLMREFVRAATALHPDWRFVLIGRGSTEFATELHREFAPRRLAVVPSGALAADAASCWISACDCMVQPYHDGLTSRRGSFLAALALGKAVISNWGPHSESFWSERGAAFLVENAAPDSLVRAIECLIAHPDVRRAFEANAYALYRERFSFDTTLEHLVQQLRAD